MISIWVFAVIVITVSFVPVFAIHQNTFPPTAVENATAIANLTNVSLFWNQPNGGTNFDENSLKAYYKFDETGTTTAKDSSLIAGSLVGINQNETARGVARTDSMQGIVGKFGSAFDFPDTGDGKCCTNPNDKKIVFGGGNTWKFLNTLNGNKFSYSFWYKTSDSSGSHYIISALGTSGGSGGIELRFDSDGVDQGVLKSCIFRFGNGASSLQKISDPHCIITDGNWHFYTFVYETNLIKIYKDGSIFQTILGVTTINDDWSGTSMMIGDLGTFGSFPASGLIDELAFWNKALSLTEITNLYNNGIGLELEIVSSPISYSIIRNSIPIATISASTTKYTDLTPAPDTNYVYGIQGINEVGSSSIVNTNEVNTNSKPTSPKYVTPNKISELQTILFWLEPDDDGEGNPTTGLNLTYNVFRQNVTAGGDFVQIANGIKGFYYEDSTPEDDFNYKVFATNELGGTNSSISSQVTPIKCGPGTQLTLDDECVPIPLTDSDGDGIPDHFDQCPDDPNKIVVGFNGCGIPESQLISCGPGTTLNIDTNQCDADVLQQITCGTGTILNGTECIVDNIPKMKKIILCHKEKETMQISYNALSAHLAHGDKLGICDEHK